MSRRACVRLCITYVASLSRDMGALLTCHEMHGIPTCTLFPGRETFGSDALVKARMPTVS